MRRVLITGGSGFIGRCTIEPLLERDFEVIVTDLVPSSTPGARSVACDLLHAESVTRMMEEIRPSHLLHLAWYVKHGEFWHARENLDWLVASLHLVETFERLGGKRVVAAGTCAEYDWRFGVCSEESTPLSPSTPYGVAKDCLRRALDSLYPDSLQVAWGRLFFLVGPGEAPGRLVPSVARSLLLGEPARCSSGRQIRDFLDVRDAGRAFAALVATDCVGTCNIASGVPRSIREIVESLGVIAERPELVKLGSRPDRDGDPAVLLADVSRLHRLVSFEPAYSLERSLRDSIDYWRQRR